MSGTERIEEDLARARASIRWPLFMFGKNEENRA